MAERSVESSLPLKKKRLSLSLKRRKDGFAKISENEVEECKKKFTCKNTDRSQTWAYCVFKAWLENQLSSDLDEQVTLYEESDLYSEDAEKVCAMLCTFIAEARQQNGSPYSPKSLLQLVTNLQSYALKIDA